MEDRYTYSRQGSGAWRSLRDGDFEEEDVWAVLKERKDSTAIKFGQSIEESSSVVTVRRHLPSAARMIPRTFSAVNNSGNIGSFSSSSSHGANAVKQQQQSAPVNIPDWSKFTRNNKLKKGSLWHDDDEGDENDDNNDDDEEFDSKLPPHEFLAKRQARSQIWSFSVFEGVGRKLKGRDLRKVRNAVLTKTGFLE